MDTSRQQKLWVMGVALLVGIGGMLYGYDIGVVSGALLFIQKSIPMGPTETGVIVGAVLGGGLLGTLIAGPACDRFGRRTMIAVASVIFILGVFCILLANSFLSLLLARLLLGIGVGVVAVAVPLYVAEMVPETSRGKYVTFFQLFLTFGIVAAYFVDMAFTASGDWRAMFAVVLIPAAIILFGIFRLPETPRWLVANNRIEQAQSVLQKMRTQDDSAKMLVEIKASLVDSSGSWGELLSRKLALPLFIAVSIAVLNQWTGINTFLQYAPDILKDTGLGSNFASMLGSAGIGMVNFLCTILAICLIDVVGRKPLLVIGVAGVVIFELFLGLVNFLHFSTHLTGVLSLIGLLGYIFFYAIGPGVVVWLAISELLPTRVRGKAVALCLFFNSLAGTLLASIFLDLIKTIGMAGTFWFCAACSVCYLCIAYFLLPETKARTLEDIQRQFTQQQPQSTFSTEVN